MGGIEPGLRTDSIAGFVLTGGNSTRMGRDKALLPFAEGTLVEHVARLVKAATGSAILLGSPQRYSHLGLPVQADLIENSGPLGGLFTAFSTSDASRVLLTACDMPGLTVEFLGHLVGLSKDTNADCVVPETASGLHPLCAVYHRRILGAVESALFRKSLKMHDLLSDIRLLRVAVKQPAVVENVNTPAQWDGYQSAGVTEGVSRS